ncbi:hypothetical protein QL285_001644 [Trifolium repens]|nr:hypothetical protein QL285_001644 [Trifolium repens]
MVASKVNHLSNASPKPQEQPFIKSNRTPHATTRSPSPGKLDRHRPAVLPPSLSLPDVVPLLCSTLLFSISGDCFQFQFSAALFYFEFYPAFYENYCRCHNSGMLKWVMNDGATNLIGE